MYLISVANLARQPVMHAMHRMEVDESSDKFVKEFGPRASILSVMANGLAWQYLYDFSELLEDAAWSDILDQAPTELLADGSCYAIIAYLVCAAAGDYWRRIFLQCNSFPIRLLCLTATSWEKPCILRRAVAQEIIDGPLDQYGAPEPNATKLRKLFPSALKNACEKGTLSIQLFLFLTAVKQRWRADTQENESVNSMIDSIMAACPHISLGLASSRLTIRKYLRYLAKVIQRDHPCTNRAALREALVEATQYCTSCYPSLDSVLGVPGRFAVPTPIQLPPYFDPHRRPATGPSVDFAALFYTKFGAFFGRSYIHVYRLRNVTTQSESDQFFFCFVKHASNVVLQLCVNTGGGALFIFRNRLALYSHVTSWGRWRPKSLGICNASRSLALV